MTRNSIKTSLIYTVSVGVFIILVLEGLVRLIGIAPPLNTQHNYYVPDPYLPYKLLPASKISGKESEFEFEYEHNSLGFRDRDHSIEKPEGMFRILGLGDSFTYGVGAAFEDTYLYNLERMLNNRKHEHPEIEIIKCGVPRFFPEPERLLLEHYGLNYDPDLVLIGLLPNDIIDTHLGLDAVKVSDNGYLITNATSEITNRLYTNSHIFRIIFQKFFSHNNPSEIEKVNAEKKIKEEYLKMVKLANQIDAKIVLIHIPQRGPWDDNARGIASRFAEWSSLHNIPFIDVLPAMEKASQNQVLYWKKDGHCNAAGYRVIAETIFSHLVENNLVP
jgi:lysophospholipase L1-like esterase